MKLNQQTLQKSVTLSGIGLHTGQHCVVTFVPAEPNFGIYFQRTDLSDHPVMKACIDLVIDTRRGTSLGKNGFAVHTVEHALAAIAGAQLDNLIVQVGGPEIPILDGSARSFIEEFQKAGIIDLGVPKNFLEIPENIIFQDNGGVEIQATPSPNFQLAVRIDYPSFTLKDQNADLTTIDDFSTEIASCRTFCFLHELEQLHESGKIKGGDLNNAIVILDREVKQEDLDKLAKLLGKPFVKARGSGILNNVALRFPNEPARHKLLDLIGDLVLIGRPIKGKITAIRPGHSSNIAFARKLKKVVQEIMNERA